MLTLLPQKSALIASQNCIVFLLLTSMKSCLMTEKFHSIGHGQVLFFSLKDDLNVIFSSRSDMRACFGQEG